jgi:hypothetical protein
VLLECHPATVRRWIGWFNSEGLAGLADRPRCGRPPLGGTRLASRIAGLLARPGPWTLPRIWGYLGRPRISMRTLYRRVRLVAIWRRPKLWPLAKDGRRHVHTQIDSAELPVQHQTPRRGRPYTLVLTKTDDLFTRQKDARHKAVADLAWLTSTWGDASPRA